MPGAIVDLSREPPPEGLTVELCVIGSGCGGATAARVLAEAGREVVVLEEGGDLTGMQLTQRDGEMYEQLYMERGGRATEDLSITVLQGRALGGGGVINASDVVPMEAPVLEMWRTRFGLTDFAPEAIAPYQQEALADLSASVIRDEQVNRANALLREGTRSLGWKGEVMHHNRVGCAGMGTCLIGCPLNAKRNPRFVAIPAALAAGARFFTRARAVRIDDAGAELKTIAVRTLDPLGRREQGAFRLRARHVILAANAVASAQLLLRSGIGNAQVGRHLSLQPQLPIVAVFPEPVRAFRGIPQAYAVTEFERVDAEQGLGGFRIEGIMGTPGIVGTLIPLSGEAHKQAMREYDHIAASLLLAADEPTGQVRLRADGRPLVRYAHADEHKARIRAAAKAAARIYLAAGAKRVVVPAAPQVVVEREADLAKLDALSLRPASAPFLSAHQQGGLRFAPNERDGALDPAGRVYGTREVYAFDSSGFPSSASSHTMTPIIAIARFLSERLLTRLGA